MKTSVEKLFFDWTDQNTGEYPKSYQIRVHAPGRDHDGDLMTRRLVKLLQYHGSEVINFPPTLLREVYDDCCWAFAGCMFTSSMLSRLDEEPYAAYPCNYAHMTHDEWVALSDSITDCMRLRIVADTSKYFQVVAPVADDFREEINKNERVIKANEEYAATGDWILSLEDQSLMPELVLTLLGLRRGFWRAFFINSDKFEIEPVVDDDFFDDTPDDVA